MKKLLFISVLLSLFFSAIAQQDKIYTSIENALANKEKVFQLDQSGQRLYTAPKEIGELTNLRKLNLSYNNSMSFFKIIYI